MILARRASKRRSLIADERGIAAVEFSILAPVFCLLFVAAIDIGSAIYTRFKLDAAVSAGSNYALINAANVSSTGGATLGSNIAAIVENSEGTGYANEAIVINNGPTVTVSGGTSSTPGTLSTGGSNAPADSCYCPTGTTTAFTWGAAKTCGAGCTGGSVAGRFVTIVATRTYNPIFSSYGLIANNTITASATVQAQ
jgi:Flp pilus assembly protein TadG